MKKCAFLVVSVSSGGTENYLLRFLSFYEAEIKATVYCKSGALGELEKEFRDIGVRLRPFRVGFLNPMDFARLGAEFRKEGYDAVCDLTGNFGAFPLLMAKLVGISSRIAFFRNSSEKFKKTFFRKQYNNFITWLLPKVSTAVLSNSKTAFYYFYGKKWHKDKRFEVIYNGLDGKLFVKGRDSLRSELHIPRDAFVIGHVGRFNEQKNHETAVKVAVALCKEYEDIYFVFCGKGVDAEYRGYLRQQNLQGKILLLGVRRDINSVLRTMDCFYFPSTIEGQPNALIEAMMIGLPFVASNIDPIKETVPLQYHSQLIAPMDIENAKTKILEIKNDTLLRNSLNLSDWAIDYFKPEIWFERFFSKL